MTGVLVVSFGVYIADFGLTSDASDGKSPYLPIRVSLRAVHKEIVKNALTLNAQKFKKEHDTL